VLPWRIVGLSPVRRYAITANRYPVLFRMPMGHDGRAPSSSSLFLSRGAEVFPCFPTVNENQIASPHDPAGRRVVHGDAICREPMWLVETGTSADPRDTRVVCDCER